MQTHPLQLDDQKIGNFGTQIAVQGKLLVQDKQLEQGRLLVLGRPLEQGRLLVLGKAGKPMAADLGYLTIVAAQMVL